MSPSVSLFIGLRYWRARKDTQFVSFITFFSVVGIALGVAALIIVTSAMNGLEGRLKHRLLGTVPQVVVTPSKPVSDYQPLLDQVANHQGVRGGVPLVATEAMLQGDGQLSAVQLLGVEPAQELEFSGIGNHMLQGSLADLTPGKYGIVLGSKLVRDLNLMLGDRIKVISATGASYGPMGRVPSQRNFTLVGVFEIGAQVDGALAYIHVNDAAKLTRIGSGKVSSLRLYLDDAFAAPQIAQELKAQFESAADTVNISDWRQQYGTLFSAVKMEKNMMALLLTLIIAIAAFNVVSALVMMVTDKTADIAILKTMGLGRAQVMGVFSVQGMTSTVLGVLIGGAVGFVVALNLQNVLSALGIWLLPPGQALPVIINYGQIATIMLGALLLSYLATLYPAWRASKIQPAEALRYE
ncbi:lipoprotein-releasing ABC transporter permease subunit [Ferrimonas aestuarii]|uniref:Lipoprotein-releasing ABC transporter permease subunit n=1 Tax=Ferrimonas aestuarii TaxID=2569539 RepID=A0A4V5NWK6_9GAMM|nr:lipoprotein-releasing ABC transporter permease subunit [Ferrimonas aestuarii]TKB58528.1 lipoprotein-releasing ABC transporter permease subunit [Ferrimonas aestuarii]